MIFNRVQKNCEEIKMKKRRTIDILGLTLVISLSTFFYVGCSEENPLTGDDFVDFVLSADPDHLTIEAGSSSNTTLDGSIIYRSGVGTYFTFEISSTDLPGVIITGCDTVKLNSPIFGICIITIEVPASTIPGTYYIELLGNGHYFLSGNPGATVDTTTLYITVPGPDFSIAFETDSITVAPGQSDTVAINISRFNNNTEGIDFVIETNNPRLNDVISPANNVTGNTTDYMLNVDPLISPGNYTVIVTGTGVTTSLSRSDTLYITVTEASTAMWIDETPAGFKTTVFNDVYFKDENAGVTVGGNGTIFSTGDGGDNWINETGITTDPLHGVHSDGSVWYAVGRILVGNKGQIIRSITGSWEIVTDTIPAPLNDVFVKDANNIWTVGDGGVAYYTTDGGSNWIPMTIATGNLEQIWFTSSSNGFIGSSNPNKIFKTTNGGSNWTEVHSIASGSLLNNLFFVDSQIGYVVYGSGVDVTTTGGGSGSWSTLSNLPVSGGIQAISFSGSQFGLLVGGTSSQFVWKTEDGGLSWENDNTAGLGGFNYFLAVAVLNQTSAIAVGQFGIARRFVQ